MKMQRIWWLNSTLCAKVHLMTFDLYNYQTPWWPDCRTSKQESPAVADKPARRESLPTRSQAVARI